LCEYFISVFIAEPDVKQSSSDSITDLFTVVVTEELVEKSLSKLKSDKSPGPDGLHPMLLRETADHIAYPLTKIFQASIREGIVPDDWKKANIVPIYKKRTQNRSRKLQTDISH